MAAYWLARAKINDPIEYKKYTDRVPAIVATHGGRILARGGRYRIMERPETFHRFIVIEFPTMDAVIGYQRRREGQFRWMRQQIDSGDRASRSA